jgi:hypothetical protein
MDARTKKVESENVGYIVNSGPFSSWLGPKKKKEITSTSLTGSNPHNQSSKDHKRKLTNLHPSDPTPRVDSTSKCNVCNRLKHPDNKSPFYAWHQYANKDTKTAFAGGHAKKFRYLNTNDITGETKLPNVPLNFKNPPSTYSKPSGDGSSTKKGTHLVAFPINTPTFLNTITDSRLQNNLINCTINLIQGDTTRIRGERNIKGPEVLIEALLDSESLAGKSISPTTYQNLGGSNINSISVDRPDSSLVCSGLNNACVNISDIVHKLSISLLAENENNIDFTSSLFSFFADVRILFNTPFDLIR